MFPEHDWLPSITRIMVDQPAAFERGVVSAATGLDVGSGMRWNPFLNKFLLEDNQSLVDVFPAIAFMGAAGQALGAHYQQNFGGSMPEAERRKKILAVSPGVGTSALVDRAFFNAKDRDMVPSNTRSHGVVPQTGMEEFSTLVGSQTVDKARATSKEYMTRIVEEKIAKSTRSAIDQIADSIRNPSGPDNTEAAIEKLREYGRNGKEVRRLVVEQLKKRAVSQADRRRANNSPAARRLKIVVDEVTGFAEEE